MMTEENLEPIIIESGKYPCPGCGAFMIYSPKTQGLACGYCGTEVEIVSETTEIQEYKLNELAALASHNWGDEKRVVTCESCSGQTVISIRDVTTACVFCGSARVVTEEMDEGIRPESVIPFKMDRVTSKTNIKKWVKGKFYAPNALKNKQSVDRLNSLYVPFFTYDADTKTSFEANKGTHYYVSRTRMVNGKSKTVRERKTRWRRVSGVYMNYYDDVLIDASSKVDESLVLKMHSFDLTELVKYDEAYLVGHATERYNKSLTSGWHDARDHVDEAILKGIKAQVNGDEFRLINKSTEYGDVLFKHILLPIWLTSYMFKNKVYNVYINGQNGRVVGEYPKSIFKIMMTVLAIAIVIFIAYYFISEGEVFV